MSSSNGSKKVLSPNFAMKIANDLFFTQSGLSEAMARKALGDALKNADDGELFLEYTVSENFTWDDGRLRSASYDIDSGFGMRGVADQFTAFTHSSDFSDTAIKEAAKIAAEAGKARQVNAPLSTIIPITKSQNTALYTADNPLDLRTQADKIALLQKVDAYVRAKDPRVKQVSVSLSGAWTVVKIMRPDGQEMADIRPMVRMNVSTVMEQTINGVVRREAGSYGFGGRVNYDRFFNEDEWKYAADQAVRMAEVNLQSIPAPSGNMEVVLGPGWPGVLLHEAVGHGLEGDFNRKGLSAFSGKIGQQVAAKGVTVVDQGDIADRRGSLTFDDEGTPTQRNVLIEDGVLKGYMQDRMNARLMGVAPTGNGRRESYRHAPMPRMTNTFMEAGGHDPEEMVKSLERGIWAVGFSGGQVDITSGNFTFVMNEAYLVEKGKIIAPLKGATLIGNGPEAMKTVSMVGTDLKLDPGIGTCGKGGQGVPAGIGQPSVKLKITVGGGG